MNNSTEVRNDRILVIDDNPSIHEDIRKILGPRGGSNAAMAQTSALLFGEVDSESDRIEFNIDSAFQGEEGLGKVHQASEAGHPYALAFVDIRMPPGWDGVETIIQIWKKHPDLQVVICTAYSDYSWEAMIRKIGKSDSLVVLKKPFDNIEVLQLAHALTEKWVLNHQVKCRLKDLDGLVSQRTTELQTANDTLKVEIAERMQAEKSLRLSEERFSKAFRASPIPLAIQSLKQETYVDANQGFQELTGFSRDALIGHRPEELEIWGDQNVGNAILQKLRAQVSIRNQPCRLRTKTSLLRDILLSVELFELDGEHFFLTIAQDITEQTRLESQLRQAQKMEAVGQLAAGVAHDFNNILTVVQGHASLLLAGKPPESTDRKPLQTISAAAERACKLVRQLLTFSRKQFLQIRPMDVRHTVSTVADMLPRILGEHIIVEVIAASSLPSIDADAGMMEQMLMNLALNARDAMEGGGRLTISAEAVDVSSEATRENHEARPGRFVCLSVSDTGCGIPADILPHVFEPFFTTKPVGKGTGLGLSTVYGIAKQHEGWVVVKSQPEQGSTFQVFIPICDKKSETPPVPSSRQPAKGGDETILVAEDEDPVRSLVVQVLESHGYNVVVAASGVQAIEEWSRRKQHVDLLLTDMVMPGGVMGRELAMRLLAEDPGLKVIYTSGYSPGLEGQDLPLLEGRNFLAKPYAPAKLLQVVRNCLDRRPQAVSSLSR